MYREYAVLGLPIENLDLKQAILKIITLIDIYPVDSRTRYVCCVNIDYLANLYSWMPLKLRNPELLNILEHAALLTVEDAPLVWLSSLLDNPLKMSISGADLLTNLCEELAKEGRSIYFIGAEDKRIYATVDKLKETYPTLNVAGIACPQIEIEGLLLQEVQERDELILEQIHEAKPDVLILSLNCPKQEIWYGRVHRQLQVPIAIGVGNELNEDVTNVKRVSQWFKKLINFTKFFFLTAPLILYHYINKIVFRIKERSSPPFPIESFLFLSPKKTLALIPLPNKIDHTVLELLEDEMQQSIQHDVLILDFQNVGYLDLEGLNWLLHTWKIAKTHRKPLLALGVSGDIRMLLKLHRIWDFISADCCESPKEVLSRLSYLSNSSSLYESVQQHSHYVILSFFGILNESRQYSNYLQRLIPMLSRKDCILDLSYCSLIDNAGFAFLLKLRKMVLEEGMSLSIWGMHGEIYNQFKQAKLDKLFTAKEKKLI